jgi:hypothetical protein
MTTRELRIDSSGVVGIVNYANRNNAFSDPLNNLQDVYFHTNLPYLQLKQTLFLPSIVFSAAPQAFYTPPPSGGGGCGGGC